MKSIRVTRDSEKEATLIIQIDHTEKIQCLNDDDGNSEIKMKLTLDELYSLTRASLSASSIKIEIKRPGEY